MRLLVQLFSSFDVAFAFRWRPSTGRRTPRGFCHGGQMDLSRLAGMVGGDRRANVRR